MRRRRHDTPRRPRGVRCELGFVPELVIMNIRGASVEDDRFVTWPPEEAREIGRTILRYADAAEEPPSCRLCEGLETVLLERARPVRCKECGRIIPATEELAR